jgi:hypothetical protein
MVTLESAVNSTENPNPVNTPTFMEFSLPELAFVNLYYNTQISK